MAVNAVDPSPHMHVPSSKKKSHICMCQLSLSLSLSLFRASLHRVLTKIDDKVVSKVDNALNQVQSSIESLTDVVEDSARYVYMCAIFKSQLGFSFLFRAAPISHIFSLISSFVSVGI